MAISFASAPPDLAATPTSPTGTPPREGTHHERRQSKGPAGPQPSGPARALAAHVERLQRERGAFRSASRNNYVARELAEGTGWKRAGALADTVVARLLQAIGPGA